MITKKNIVINGYETFFSIDTKGNVRNENKNIYLKSYIGKKGYKSISIYHNHMRYRNYVHRLVAEAFIPNPENKPQVNHINGIKTDNKVENLEWVTPKENSQHAMKMGLIKIGEDLSTSKYTNKEIHEICRSLEKGMSVKEVSKLYSISDNFIRSIMNGVKWKFISKNYNMKNALIYKKHSANKFKNEILDLLFIDYSLEPREIIKILKIEKTKGNRKYIQELKRKIKNKSIINNIEEFFVSEYELQFIN